MARGDDIEERMVEFAVRIVKLCEKTPQTYAGRHLANQLLRNGTSPAAQYAEARGAESNKDFAHKLKICLKELNETSAWLRIIERSELFHPHLLASIHQECSELSKIVNASIRTVQAKASH